jgi:hypothetical protein
MDPVQRLVELDALYRLKASYFRFFDTKDWDSWLGLFLEDAVLKADATPEKDTAVLVLNGRKAMGDFLIPRGATRKTCHQGHNPEIDFQSDTNATGIWAMEDTLEYADHVVHGQGHYHETYAKVNGTWRFASVHLKRLRVNTYPILSLPPAKAPPVFVQPK